MGEELRLHRSGERTHQDAVRSHRLEIRRREDDADPCRDGARTDGGAGEYVGVLLLPVEDDGRVEQRHRQPVHSSCASRQVVGKVLGLARGEGQRRRTRAKSVLGGCGVRSSWLATITKLPTYPHDLPLPARPVEARRGVAHPHPFLPRTQRGCVCGGLGPAPAIARAAGRWCAADIERPDTAIRTGSRDNAMRPAPARGPRCRRGRNGLPG